MRIDDTERRLVGTRGYHRRQPMEGCARAREREGRVVETRRRYRLAAPRRPHRELDTLCARYSETPQRF